MAIWDECVRALKLRDSKETRVSFQGIPIVPIKVTSLRCLNVAFEQSKYVTLHPVTQHVLTLSRTDILTTFSLQDLPAVVKSINGGRHSRVTNGAHSSNMVIDVSP